MELVHIEENEFNEVAKTFSCKNFFQTSYMGESLNQRGKKVYYLGLKDKEKIVAASLLYESNKFLGKKIFVALKGYLIDYQNAELLKMFTTKLLEFIKRNNGFQLVIDPYIIEIQRDINGNIVNGGQNNYQVIENLKHLGFIKSKYDTQVKYNFCLNLNKSEDEIFSDFKATTRNIINKAIREGVEIVNLKKEDLNQFKEITADTCKRRGFTDKTIEYYQSMYDCFKDLVVFKLARLNVSKYLEYLNAVKKDYQEKYDKIKSNNKKKENYLFEINNIEKKIEKIKCLPIKDGYVNLSAAMFILYGDETIYLFSGSYDNLNEFGGQYLIQWDIIKYAIKNGYKRHNFFGIYNFTDPKNKEYGIYLFKKGFNGYVEELLGEYYICTNTLTSKLYKLKQKL